MMSDYTKEEIEFAAMRLADEVRLIRDQAAVTPARPDVVYLAEAANISNVGLTGSQMEEVLAEQRVAVMFDKLDDFFTKHKATLVLIAFGLGLPLFAYVVFVMMSQI